MPNENKYEKRLTDAIDYEKLQLGSETYVCYNSRFPCTLNFLFSSLVKPH